MTAPPSRPMLCARGPPIGEFLVTAVAFGIGMALRNAAPLEPMGRPVCRLSSPRAGVFGCARTRSALPAALGWIACCGVFKPPRRGTGADWRALETARGCARVRAGTARAESAWTGAEEERRSSGATVAPAGAVSSKHINPTPAPKRGNRPMRHFAVSPGGEYVVKPFMRLKVSPLPRRRFAHWALDCSVPLCVKIPTAAPAPPRAA
jgi:hypothetical protein